MKDLVSVIIPTYGGGDGLYTSIESVLNQSYDSFEIIVVDDNGIGTENQVLTQKRIEKLLNYEKVKYYCHEKNMNGSAARNTGFSKSHGKYIALLDDDDIYDKDKLKYQVKSLEENPEHGMSYCSYEKYDQDGNLIATVHANMNGNLLYPILSHTVSLTSGSLLIRREVWESVKGFDESFRRHQDWEFVARVASNNMIISVPQIGLRKKMYFRNSAKNADQAKKYRIHYLDKMQPYINSLSKKEQKRVIVANRLDIALMYLKEKNTKAFIKEYLSTKPGVYGIRFLTRRLLGKAFGK